MLISRWQEKEKDDGVEGRERERSGTRYNFQRHTPRDLLPRAKPHPLKFPAPLKLASPNLQP
jgi:hypothetical protein